MSYPEQVNVVFVYGAGDDDRWGGGLRYLQDQMKDYFGDKIYSPDVLDHRDLDQLKHELEEWSDPTILIGHSCGGQTVTQAATALSTEVIPYLMVIAPSIFCSPDSVYANVERITQASSAPGDRYNPDNATLISLAPGNTRTVLDVIQTRLPHVEAPYSLQVRDRLIEEIERALGVDVGEPPVDPNEPPIDGETPPTKGPAKVTVTIDYPSAEVEVEIVKKPTVG